MKVYSLIDYTGSKSVHLAKNFDSAVQAHLQHYGLLHLSGNIKQTEVRDLKNIKDRSSICWDSFCVIAGVSNYESNEKN